MGAFHTASAQGSAQKILKFSVTKVQLRFTLISDPSCRMYTLVDQLGFRLVSELSPKPSQCEMPHGVSVMVGIRKLDTQ